MIYIIYYKSLTHIYCVFYIFIYLKILNNKKKILKNKIYIIIEKATPIVSKLTMQLCVQ